MKQLLFVDYSQLFLEKSWSWLNDEEIKQMTMTPDFTKEDQNRFFETLPTRKDYFIKGILFEGKPIGACGLKNISETSAEYWGYIGEKEYWGKGLGSEIVDFMLDKTKDLKLNNIYLCVSSSNIRAKKLYLKKGFVVESVEGTITKMIKIYDKIS